MKTWFRLLSLWCNYMYMHTNERYNIYVDIHNHTNFSALSTSSGDIILLQYKHYNKIKKTIIVKIINIAMSQPDNNKQINSNLNWNSNKSNSYRFVPFRISCTCFNKLAAFLFSFFQKYLYWMREINFYVSHQHTKSLPSIFICVIFFMEIQS